MGWDACSTWTKKSDVVAGIQRDYSPRIIESKSTRSGLWAIMQGQDGKQHITVFLIQRQCGRLAYKPITEMEHPYYYDCPLEYLARCPDPQQYESTEWRRRCSLTEPERRAEDREDELMRQEQESKIKLLGRTRHPLTTPNPKGPLQ